MFSLWKWDDGGEEGTRLVTCNLPTILCTVCVISKPHPLLHSRKVWWRYTVHIVNKFLSAQLQVVSIHLYQTLSCVQRRVWPQNYCMHVHDHKLKKSGSSSWSGCNWGPAAKQIQLWRCSWNRCNWGAVEEPAVIGDAEQQLKCSSRVLFSKDLSSWVGQWTSTSTTKKVGLKQTHFSQTYHTLNSHIFDNWQIRFQMLQI